MIIDNIANISVYESIMPGIADGMKAISDASMLEEGRYEFNGGYFMVQTGETAMLNEGTFEAHKKYIDVQILLEGCEEIAWSDVNDLKVEIPYNEEKDTVRFNGEKKHHMLISDGMFYIAFPHDGHQAVSHTETKYRFKKVVLKLLI